MKYLLCLLSLCLSTALFAEESKGKFTSPTIQVGVVVRDLEKSLHFYKDIVGMTETRTFTVSPTMAKRLGLTDGRRLDVTVLKLEDSEAANEWKIMSFNERPTHAQQDYIYDDTGMQYITIYVDSVKPYLERLREHGVELLGESPTPLNEDTFMILVQDPDGTFVELIGGE